MQQWEAERLCAEASRGRDELDSAWSKVESMRGAMVTQRRDMKTEQPARDLALSAMAERDLQASKAKGQLAELRGRFIEKNDDGRQ